VPPNGFFGIHIVQNSIYFPPINAFGISLSIPLVSKLSAFGTDVPPTFEPWLCPWLTWMSGYIPWWFACGKIMTHPITNQARCRVILLLETSMLPLGYSATDCCFFEIWAVICNLHDFLKFILHILQLLLLQPFYGPLDFVRDYQGVSRYQKGKTNLDLLEQEIVSGSGISCAICKSAPHPRQISMPASHHSVFLQAQPTASKHWGHMLCAYISFCPKNTKYLPILYKYCKFYRFVTSFFFKLCAGITQSSHQQANNIAEVCWKSVYLLGM